MFFIIMYISLSPIVFLSKIDMLDYALYFSITILVIAFIENNSQSRLLLFLKKFF
jgi:hypothetical protein